jgi:hypothetical protein
MSKKAVRRVPGGAEKGVKNEEAARSDAGGLGFEPEHDPEKLQTFRTRSCSELKTLERYQFQPEGIAL